MALFLVVVVIGGAIAFVFVRQNKSTEPLITAQPSDSVQPAEASSTATPSGPSKSVRNAEDVEEAAASGNVTRETGAVAAKPAPGKTPARKPEAVPAGGAQIPIAVEKGVESEPKLSTDEFLTAFRGGLARGDVAGIKMALDKMPNDPGLTDALKVMMNDPSADAATQRYAAEALMRVGTAESVQYVLGQLLAAYRSGDKDRANTLLASLEAPTSAAGTRAIFDFLLGQGNFAHSQEVLPQEAVSAARKALLAAPDREAVGNLAARLYLDPQTMTNNVAMWELFDGVSHPLMLAQLAAHAYQENLPDNAAQFLDRLGASDDQSVVQALVQMVPNPSVPLDNAAMALYDWSVAHPQVAQPGLFIEYMTDQNRAPEQRSVAAFGLAGSSNREYAQQAIQKALSLETAPSVRTNLQTALDLLNQERPK
jgi:hypothetical protein